MHVPDPWPGTAVVCFSVSAAHAAPRRVGCLRVASGQGMFRDPVAREMQELSILDYPLVHHSAPIKAAAALLSAVSFQTKTLRPYLDEMKVLACCCVFKL